MTFKPLVSSDRWYGLLAMFALVGLDMILVRIILSRPVDGLSFLMGLWVLGSVLIFFYLGYRTIGVFTMEYWIDRDAITLVWGPTRQVVPIGQIERVLVGTTARPANRARPWHWPCPHRRRVFTGELGVVNAYATRPLAEQVILKTPGESYGLAPADARGLVAALQTRYALGVARPLQPTLQRPPLWTWPLWRDRAALALIGAGLLGVLLMFGALCFRYPILSSDLPLHFDVAGLPDRIEPKSGLFVLPLIGLIAWGFNLIAGVWLYRRVQQGAAYLLWGGAVVVQIIAGLALFNLMRW
jgi:hypothetical protein